MRSTTSSPTERMLRCSPRRHFESGSRPRPPRPLCTRRRRRVPVGQAKLELVQEPGAPLSANEEPRVARGSSSSLAGLDLTVSPNIAGPAGHEDFRSQSATRRGRLG